MDSTHDANLSFQHSGTSFATPVVSGVIALMLDVNPELGWRDVQAILALTARETDPDDESWVTNGAGLRHSNKYGFGIVNANSAVNMAETWVTYPPELELTAESGPIDLVIPDDADQTVESTLSICKGQNGFTVESVVIFIGYQHGMRGNLNIMLTSPSGTASALHPSKRYERTTLLEGTRWELMTVRNWGESPVGDWTLSVTDERLGDGDLPNASSVNYLKNWDISIYGRVEEAGSPSPILRMPHILTLAGLATVTFFL
jgi:subtilisin-like proprotein convertase family protein